MALLMTHSLLSSWLYSMKDDPFGDATTEKDPREEFLRVLRREPTEQTEAMLNGIEFENLVTDILKSTIKTEWVPEEGVNPVTGESFERKTALPRWYDAASAVADKIRGAKLQFVATKKLAVERTEFLLYGRLDALRAGQIYDIKFSKSYERGKYVDSTQHPMYLELVPGAEAFTYLVSNGTEVWTEKYRRDETPSIIPVIRDFLAYLHSTGLIAIYEQYWQART